MKLLVLFVCLGVAGAQTVADVAEAMKGAMEKQRAAMLLQRQAAARQAEFAAKYRWSPPVTASLVNVSEGPECPALAEAALDPLLESASKRQGVAFDVLKAVARQESGFRPCAVSPKGAKGLMQLMPATATQLSVSDLFDPEQNVQAGARYLKDLLTRYQGDLKLALAAYNAGPGNVSAAGGVPDLPETRNYVEAIMRALGRAEEVTRSQPPASPAILPHPPAQ